MSSMPRSMEGALVTVEPAPAWCVPGGRKDLQQKPVQPSPLRRCDHPAHFPPKLLSISRPQGGMRQPSGRKKRLLRWYSPRLRLIANEASERWHGPADFHVVAVTCLQQVGRQGDRHG